MNSRARGRRVLLAAVLCCAPVARGHDLITSELAERYLVQVQYRLDVLHSQQPVPQRAWAATHLGRTLDEIHDLLNRDLAEHGRIQGLPTEYLMRELKAKGLSLEVSPTLGRFPANVSWYREALRLSPDGPHAGEASFGWLKGDFYDSFDTDPLRARHQSWADLQEQIALGERTIKLQPAYPEIEEAKFILAVLYTRAARIAPDRRAREQYADRARASIAEFQSRYAESLRAAALPLLLQALGHPSR
jgi:hypothetical protein